MNQLSRRTCWTLGILSALVSASCHRPSPPTSSSEFVVEIILEGLTIPASLNFAPDGTLLILERGKLVDGEETPAKLKSVTLANREITEISGAPAAFPQFGFVGFLESVTTRGGLV